MTQAYDRLKALLGELFQFDREDLDFGIYRIMNQKRDEVSKFLDEDLLPQVQEAFREYRAGDEEGARRDLANLEKTLGDAGVTAESSPKYVALKRELAARSFDRVYANGDNTLALKSRNSSSMRWTFGPPSSGLMFESRGV